MKKITKQINETVESSVTGFSFSVKADKIESCVIVIGDNNRISSPRQKIIIPAREIPKQLLEDLDTFIDSRLDNEGIVNPTVKVIEKKGKKKNAKNS